jgi:hypothetical protein
LNLVKIDAPAPLTNSPVHAPCTSMTFCPGEFRWP